MNEEYNETKRKELEEVETCSWYLGFLEQFIREMRKVPNLSSSMKLWLQEQRFRAIQWKVRLNEKGYSIYSMKDPDKIFWVYEKVADIEPLPDPLPPIPMRSELEINPAKFDKTITKEEYEFIKEQVALMDKVGQLDDEYQLLAEKMLLYEQDNDLIPFPF